MRLLRLWLLVSVVAGLGTMTSEAVLPQARDAGTHPTTATASISGVVVDDEQPARPVRRAVVTLTGAGLRPNRGAITDDEGRFTLRDLPAGRFTLTAERGAFITSSYEAKRPGRPGTEITVADGQQIADVRLRLWRGAVLSGVVRDESGEPLANVPVAAVPSRDVGPAALTLSNNNQATTNDLGEYRIFGLEPGTYIVRAGSGDMGRLEIAASEADIDAKLAALANRTRQPGAAPREADRVTTAPTIVSAAPIYFPGTPVAADATPITLRPGQESSGLDFAVRRIRTATIRGTVVGPDGTPVPRAFVRLAARSTSTQFASTRLAPMTISSGSDGAFELSPVSQGTYVLMTRASVAPPTSSGGGSLWWATMPVTITEADVDLATLTLQPGMTFSGRVVFDSSATTPRPDPATLRVQMQATTLAPAGGQRGAAGGATDARVLRPAIVNADGTFTVQDLVPDDYQLIVSGGPVDGSRWWLRAATVNGVDLLDAPLQLAPGENVRGVTLVLSDRHSELSGTLTTAGGAGVSDIFVLAFPADAALRQPHSRRVQAVRPDNSGRFVFKDLPAGEYLISALTDVDGDEWNDPTFLAPLVSVSAKVTVADGKKTVQDLQLRQQ